MIIFDRLPKETGRDYAVRVIRKNINQLTLAPGAMVSENELSVQLGLSRTPVRESLIELSKVNIVEIFPQKGSRVSLIDYNLVEEARFMRLVLERAIIETLCTSGLSPAHQSQILENLQLQKFYLENPCGHRLFELDEEFHAMLFRFANRQLSYHLVKNFSVHFDRVRNISMGRKSEHDEALVRDHQAIYQSILSQDVQAAVDAATAHLTGYKVDAQLIRNMYPDYIAPVSSAPLR